MKISNDSLFLPEVVYRNNLKFSYKFIFKLFGHMLHVLLFVVKTNKLLLILSNSYNQLN